MKSEKPDGGDVFDIDRIRQIVELMEQHELNEVDLQQADDRIKLTRGGSAPAMIPAPAMPAAPAAPAPAPAAASAPAPAAAGGDDSASTAGTITINSPMVGTFYSKANPEAPPFAKVGDVVSEDTVVCIVEAMKVFNEIPAECRGKIVEVLVSDQQAVDFGKPLFRVQVDG
ncbi:acetyl-CoA carboxylase biotin carboxyl carrier protein [Rhodopirellula halodulae]|uniref:acetyl-CoA carboxylase biotin carboxyl carrier protein n=1 Tax=Rhodopirellula halodulae TaxID=2894198 RepID=UPI001E613D2E|nr:acetyl-CoA carboxylase biotin carboxyl carrier protein [Rhodopirellula sp. JC737]MCC9657139.1 acetyl-CoA carboxylase biotin carboxyl carrier protein [Rhodopirellula sp. JC737]